MKNQKQSRNQTGYTLLIAAFMAAGLMGSCSPKSAVTGTKVMTVEYLAQGKVVFDNSCGKCHDLPNPTAHSAQNWVGIMNSMAPKAKLNDAQHQMVYDYIVSVK
ncbi:cytochrome C [Chryseobacterium gotjawalense]|uniref:Cytochrome C n=1 Tax=Chryseobacterium gotjawalense TaxID=3042315 RepID=A0ABY8R9K1_9FLAO|nr:cytochrome C [Chryseobacterium sp. wdc7]WHF50627.1 cytochrome C [Chryseobacterium sp. wdc7]